MLQCDTYRWSAIFVALASLTTECGVARGQAPGGSGAYFQQKTIASAYGGGPVSSNRYLYDKYFYHRPTVSPYLNLERPDTLSGTAYQAYVRPEAQRRAQSSATTKAYIQQRKLEGRVGDTRYPGAIYSGGTSSNVMLPFSKPPPASALVSTIAVAASPAT